MGEHCTIIQLFHRKTAIPTARYHRIMSSFLSQAQKKAEETVKQGEHTAQDCVDKGKEIGQKVIDKGCEAAKNTCDQVTGQVGEKLSSGWMKQS